MALPELHPYPPLSPLLDRAATYGDVHQYGTSTQGRPLLAIRVGGDGPPVLVTAGIHGLEYIGVRVALEVARRGPIPGATLWVCPVLNPDGYAATWERQGHGAVARFRKNAQGVDLNRNFPLPWSARPSRIALAGSPDPAHPTYRGPAPLSEPETRHLADWIRTIGPHGSVNLHSFMGTLICARVWHPADWRAYTALCRAFRRGQGRWLGYPRLGTPVGDVFTGELEDWLHHTQQCWATCVEAFTLRESLQQHWRAPSSFWRFNPRHPDPVAERDAAGVRAMLGAMASRPRPPVRAGAATTRLEWSPDD